MITVLNGGIIARVDRFITVDAFPAKITVTPVVVHFITAFPVHTGVVNAVIFIYFTVIPCVSVFTAAFVGIGTSISAVTTIVAWIGVTVINILITVYSSVAGSTAALIGVDQVSACGAVLAWITGTLIRISFAECAFIAIITITFDSTISISSTIAIVVTRGCLTHVLEIATILSRVTLWANTII
jgi:hypothetical protein